MSRQRVPMLRASLAFAMLCTGIALSPPALAQEKEPARTSVADMLGLAFETKDFTQPMSLKEFLQLIYEKCAIKGIDLPILVDVNSFREGPDAQPAGPYEDEIRLPAIPKTMTLGQVLQLAVSQIKSNNGAISVRNGGIVIETRKSASLAARLREPVLARFDKTPFSEVMQRLSDMTGASILLDPRLKEKAQAPITADFRGDVPLESALRAVADMAELRIVLLIEGGIYVTTPANADALEKSIRQRKEELEKEKAREVRDAA